MCFEHLISSTCALTKFTTHEHLPYQCVKTVTMIWAWARQNKQNKPPHSKTNKMGCAPSEDSDQPGHPPSEDSDQPGHPPSLIRVFAVRMKKAWVLSYPLSAQRRLWSDWADAQADLSLRWPHTHFVGFVTRRLKWPVRPVLSEKPFLHTRLEFPCASPVQGNFVDVIFRQPFRRQRSVSNLNLSRDQRKNH